MRIKILCILLFSLCLILIFSLVLIIRKHYLSYNLLKLDPLEFNSSQGNKTSISMERASIWLIGDSRIARWNEELLGSFPGETINLGVEGQTSAQCLALLKNNLEVAAPVWLVMEIGINDLKLIGLDKSLRTSITERCYGNITSIIQACKEINVQVIVLSIFPTGDIEFFRHFLWNKEVDKAIVELNDWLRAYCQDSTVIYCDAYNILGEGDNKVKKDFQHDFLHINKGAYAVLTSYLITHFNNTKQNYN